MIARKEKRLEESSGARASMLGCVEGGVALQAESSVRRRFVGEREEDDDVVDIVVCDLCSGGG